jgi:rhomboid protease GluP
MWMPTLDNTQSAAEPRVAVFSAATAAVCDQRVLMLHAVGIESQAVPIDDGFTVLVTAAVANAARDQLARYATELAAAEQAVTEPAPRLVLHAHAWIAPLLYVLLLLAVSYCAGGFVVAGNWYEQGALLSAVYASGEWWRVVTAQTLHLDHGHLLGNLGFGALFLYWLAALRGYGTALLGALLAAALGNLLDSALMPATHIVMGASSTVFAALGWVAADGWNRQRSRLRWVQRSAPLLVGIMLLGLLGAGDENTDVLAHLAGFACGVVFGVCYARLATAQLDVHQRSPHGVRQKLATVLALALCGAAWAWALAV